MLLDLRFGDAGEEITTLRSDEAVHQGIDFKRKDTFEEIKLEFEIAEVVLSIDIWR